MTMLTGSFPDYSRVLVQPLSSAWLSSRKTEIAVLRLDLLHPEISGNKWFKLKYNLEAAGQQNKDTVLTFGGPWSNHIAATAAACCLLGFNSIGIIRGAEHDNGRKDKANLAHTATLTRARENGMQLHFISREDYRRKDEADFTGRLAATCNNPYIIPEGGNNALGIRGCKEILSLGHALDYTHVCCPVGTGATLAGLIGSARPEQRVLGFAALKNAAYLRQEIAGRLAEPPACASWELITGYHFGGFARKTDELLQFMKDFSAQHGIPLDFVYTGKMMFGIMDMIGQGRFGPGSRILAIHTGGLQGNRSLESRDIS